MRQTEPGEWQRDETGRRFRMMGNIKEYEAEIIINGIPVPESQLSAYHAARKAVSEPEKRETPKTRTCPFDGGIENQCRENCALHTVHGCALVYMVRRKPARGTAGKKCPFSAYSCRESCALYNNGCVLAAI